MGIAQANDAATVQGYAYSAQTTQEQALLAAQTAQQGNALAANTTITTNAQNVQRDMYQTAAGFQEAAMANQVANIQVQSTNYQASLNNQLANVKLAVGDFN